MPWGNEEVVNQLITRLEELQRSTETIIREQMVARKEVEQILSRSTSMEADLREVRTDLCKFVTKEDLNTMFVRIERDLDAKPSKEQLFQQDSTIKDMVSKVERLTEEQNKMKGTVGFIKWFTPIIGVVITIIFTILTYAK